jgi:FkbH-like protein
MLGRAPESEAIRLGMQIESVPRLISVLAESGEFQKRQAASDSPDPVAQLIEQHKSHRFSAPADLSRTPSAIGRVAFVGACFMEAWLDPIGLEGSSTVIDHYLFNNAARLPELSAEDIAGYAFQVVQIPLRSVVPEGSYMRLSYHDTAAYERLFAESCERMRHLVTAALAWNSAHGLLSFVCNYMVPQQNPMGRLLARNDLRNLAFMIRRLNDELLTLIGEFRNVYLLDIEEQSAIAGKRYIQDDAVWLTTHGAMLNDWDHAYDQDRIHPTGPLSVSYDGRVDDFVLQLWAELEAMYRTIRAIDVVKLVIVDLDDTLWRGVAAESGTSNIEGWPLGFIEALTFLKKRGVLLAVVSKNDEARIAEIWDEILGGRLALGDFAVRRINWQPKAQNIREIIAEVNVLPASVVFIDDNPIEVAAVTAELPEIRTLGSAPHYVKRILLWSAETQIPLITEESARRTEMIQAQVERESRRNQLSRAEFLASLDTRVSVAVVTSEADRRFGRAFELINKTNQFNTNGERWTPEMCAAHFAARGAFYTFDVQDNFSKYGLVGVAIVRDAKFLQFVMSCRVFGLEVEVATVVLIAQQLLQFGAAAVEGQVTETKANVLSRDLYERCGFVRRGDVWSATSATLQALPSHVAIRFEEPT